MITFIVILLCILSVGSVAAILYADSLKAKLEDSKIAGSNYINEDGTENCPNCGTDETTSSVCHDGGRGYDRWNDCTKCQHSWYTTFVEGETYVSEEGEAQ